MSENKQFVGTKFSTGELVQMELEAKAKMANKPENIKKLQEQNFTIREIEILSKIPKSSVARELKEMSEDE